MYDIDKIVSWKLFDFRLFHYGVAHDRVQCSWAERLCSAIMLKGGKERQRFWIYRKGKYSVGEDKPAHLLFKHRSAGYGVILTFAPPHFAGNKGESSYKVCYWKDMQSPINLIEQVKARIDLKSLKDHSVFNTKDLGW